MVGALVVSRERPPRDLEIDNINHGIRSGADANATPVLRQ